MRFFLVLVLCFISIQALAGEPKFKNKYDATYYKIIYHDTFIRQVKNCPTLKINGSWPFLKLGKAPNYPDNDPRWASYERAGDIADRDAKAKRKAFIAKNGIKNYCQHLANTYGPDSNILHAIRSVSLEEKAGLEYRPLKGCIHVPVFVEYAWPCDLTPEAKPKECEATKRRHEARGICRANFGVLTNGLKPTGKTHDRVWHKKFTGLKSSGPFIEVKDKEGALWWIKQFDWEYATEKVK